MQVCFCTRMLGLPPCRSPSNQSTQRSRQCGPLLAATPRVLSVSSAARSPLCSCCSNCTTKVAAKCPDRLDRRVHHPAIIPASDVCSGSISAVPDEDAACSPHSESHRVCSPRQGTLAPARTTLALCATAARRQPGPAKRVLSAAAPAVGPCKAW